MDKIVDYKTRTDGIETFPTNMETENIVESDLQPGDMLIAKRAGLFDKGIEMDNLQPDPKPIKIGK